tara:strand:+ start:1151 stop:2137 length:987 start_codon:yes stop_codon:yes gene_type:complete
MNKKIKVLVTGAGNGVGQSIIRSLNLSKLNLEVIISDIDKLNTQIYNKNKSIIIPKVEDKKSKQWFIKNLIRKKIDVLFVGSEYEIEFFSRNKKEIENKTKTLICVSPTETIKISLDKFHTYKFLKKNNFPFPRTFLPKNLDQAKKIIKKLKTPFYLKDRFGTSSRNVYLIKDKKCFSGLYILVPNPIIQEFAGFKGESLKNEFTCGIFTLRNGKLIGPFIAKRILKNGTSWVVEVVKQNRIKKLIIKIAKKLKNIGSLNIQLRDGPKGLIPIEFNARFSGTTSIRAFFGFNEPEMFIKNYFLNRNIKNPKIKLGRVFRYTEEVYQKR